MSALFILMMQTPHQPELLDEYRKLGRAAFEGRDAKFLVRPDCAVESVEGDPVASVVVVEFPTLADARDFYHSAAYTEAVAIRLSAVVSHAVLVETI